MAGHILRRPEDLVRTVTWASNVGRVEVDAMLSVDTALGAFKAVVFDWFKVRHVDKSQESRAAIRDVLDLIHLAKNSRDPDWGDCILASVKEAEEPTLYPKVFDFSSWVVEEIEVPRRCDPEHPVSGRIDFGDPPTAPPHGDIRRYRSRKYKCGCVHCRRANTALTSARRERQKSPCHE